MADKKVYKETMMKRRNAKGALTRQGNAIGALLEAGRPQEEVIEGLAKLKTVYEDLERKHEEFTLLIESDEEYEEEEKWMEACQRNYLDVQCHATEFISKMNQAKQDNGNGNEKKQMLTEDSGSATATATCAFKVEKPRMPQFSGDVREYFIFRSDFKHPVDTRYSKRGAIALLRTCLTGKPLDLIKGIGSSDYDAAWEYLDSIYGDPRSVADIITQDIVRFRPLHDDEDARFCELVHLVRRSFNTLKEVGLPNDMDNNHMLAIIEQRMHQDDRKVWSRYLESEKEVATLKLLMEWMNTEMKSRMRAMAPVRCSNPMPRSVSHVNGPVNEYVGVPNANHYGAFGANYVGDPDVNSSPGYAAKCWLCSSSDHWPDQCYRLTEMSPENRFRVAKEQRVCFSCLKKGSRTHNWSTCSRKRQCPEMGGDGQCKFYHHPLLHVPAGHNSSVGVATVNSKQALLSIICFDVLGMNGSSQHGNVLLDSGAHISLIRSSLAEALKLRGKEVVTTIIKVGGEEEELRTKMYEVRLRSLSRNSIFIVRAIGMPCISEQTEEIRIKDLSRKFGLLESDLCQGSGSVDVLVGIDHPKLHSGETREADGLVARRSPLGWVVFGSPSNVSGTSARVLHVAMSTPVDLTDFWTSEAMGVSIGQCKCEPDRLSPLELQEARVIEESCVRVGDQWLVPYPWRKDPKYLPDNRKQAMQRLQSTERKLLKTPEHARGYNQKVQEMVDMGFARKLDAEEMTRYEGPVFYISHHAVIREDKKSTPLRIVFNSSASFMGHSLNDYWMKGPDLLNGLFGVILRFREEKVAIRADISKMYHRVLIPERDQQVHRFLWRDLKTEEEPEVYVMNVLTFGDKPAPAMAQTALKKTAKEACQAYPAAAKTLLRNTYMDDICESVPTLIEAKDRVSSIDEVLRSGEFQVKGWLSNARLREEAVVQGERLMDVQTKENILGTVWDFKSDTVAVKMNLELSETSMAELLAKRMTKRRILSIIAKIFDPIGFASAFLVRTKMAMQRLWQQGLDWDEEIAPEEQIRWHRLIDEMKELSQISFDRCLTPPMVAGLPVICIFADASELAFGCCMYIRWPLPDGTFDVRFVAAKSRVAPLKRLTVPRLELQAAVMATRLYRTVLQETRIQIEKPVFMTDSMIVLGWIKGNARGFKPFVSHRIGEIQGNSNPSQWRHIAGERNVADELSRGISVQQLNLRWKYGPDFLKYDESLWPKESTVRENRDGDDGETLKGQTVLVVSMEPEFFEFERISSWKRLVAITAYVRRFVTALRARTDASKREHLDKGILTPQELRGAETWLVVVAQRRLHERLDKGEFRSLNPYIEEGVIKVGGRMQIAVSYGSVGPALLPAGHHVSLLIMRHVHQYGNNGVAATVAKSRTKFWILRAHRLAKTVKFRCVFCRERSHKVESQLMAELPEQRLAPYTPPFFYTACDYFGPLKVKVGRNKTTKHYGVIFTCLNTRAVHLELATDVSAMEFIQVLRRFFAVRGYPSMMISDNGTQMVGAEKELREMIKGWNMDDLKQFFADRKMLWRFTTPLAPHQNGCAESLVKTCKIALRQAIGEQVMSAFELYTVLLEVANLVNQRPIGRVPNDPDDGAYLCPNDILLGRASGEIPQGPFRRTVNPRHRVEFVQKIVDSFWKRWSRDVFPSFVPRRKWRVECRNVRVDDVVTVADSNVVRGKWRLGRIVEVYPGKDGKVRNVSVRTTDGIYRRPITKIAVILPAEGYEDEDQALMGAEDVSVEQ